MSNNPTVEDLLAQWEEFRDRGESVSPDQLCHDSPDLLAALKRCIRVEELLENYEELRHKESNVSLEQLCVDDAELLDDLKRKIRAMEAPDTLPWFDEEMDSVDETGSSAEKRSCTSAPPDQLGDYELLGCLGEGGMGVVYRARQRSADRIVALKIIRPDYLRVFSDKKQQTSIERFRAEARAAAQLEHDHIVTVYDVGETDGQQYFSMRFVDGRSLAEMLHDGPIDNQRAADYMEPIARAVHHAHGHGILHRDLKPQNILVDAKNDRPLVADFGLAKLTEEETSLTRHGDVMGTPQYMSPEQARDSASVRETSDIYSLGATLYHLLTGRPPFQAASMLETLRQVANQEPVAPRRLNPAVDRDLETVCLKCLEKDPARRYGSAELLADELQRFRNGEPIHARPISFSERTWRWCRRNPWVAWPSAAAAFFFLFALVATTVGYLKTTAALVVSVEAERQAEQSLRDELNSVNEFYTRVSTDTLLNQPGAQKMRHELLQKALTYYQDFLARRKHDPNIRFELAVAYFNVGEILDEIGTSKDALESFRSARSAFEALNVDGNADLRLNNRLGDTWNAMGKVFFKQGKIDEADGAFRKATLIREQLIQVKPDDFEFRRKLANIYMNIGSTERANKNVAATLKSYESAQKIREKLLAAGPNYKVQLDLAMQYYNWGNFDLERDDRGSAKGHFIEAANHFQKLLDRNPDHLDNQYQIALCYRRLGELEREFAKAIELYQNALDQLEDLAYQNPAVAPYQEELGMIYLKIGEIQSEQNEIENSLEFLRSAQAVFQQLRLQDRENARHDEQLKIVQRKIDVVTQRLERSKAPQAKPAPKTP